MTELGMVVFLAGIITLMGLFNIYVVYKLTKE